jgi:hypothetical protein
MALSNHRCIPSSLQSGHGHFVIDGRIIVRSVPIVTCGLCGSWATPHHEFVKLGKLAQQLEYRKSVQRHEGEVLPALFAIDFAKLPLAKTEF